jgi:nicotinamide mononucleotide (NMN) deamidase PncC
MTIFGRSEKGGKESSDLEEIINLLKSRDQTISIIEPATSGLITYRLRKH